MNKFVFNILDQVLNYDNKKIIIIFDEKGEPWFKLMDILIILGYKSTLKQPSIMGISEENKREYKDIKGIIKKKEIKVNTKFVNEIGLYEILNKSIKPIAKEFKKDILKNIIPTLRKTGEYILSEEEKRKLEKINNKLENKLKNYKEELEYYYDKYEFIPSTGGYIYINEVKMINKGNKIIGYKPGYCKNMKSRQLVYKIGNYSYKLLSYIPVNIDKNKIENCYLNLFKEHKYKSKSKNELICFINLKELKEGIIKCIKFLTENICECIYCKEKYNVKDLEKHKCMKKLLNIEFIDYDIDKILSDKEEVEKIINGKEYIEKIKNLNKIINKNSKKSSKKSSKRTNKKVNK